MAGLKIVQTIESGDAFYRIYDWDNSEDEWALIGPYTSRLADQYQCFKYPVKMMELPEFDRCRYLSHIAVRTDAYPLIWMWAWFIEKAKSIAQHDFWLMMRIAYATGLARQPMDMYPSIKDFVFWPKGGN